MKAKRKAKAVPLVRLVFVRVGGRKSGMKRNAKRKSGALQGTAAISFGNTGTLTGHGALAGTTDKRIREREASRVAGKSGGDKGGFKGGRPPKKPSTNHQLGLDYQQCLADCKGDKSAARKQFSAELKNNTDASLRTISGWLKDARIPK